MAQSLRTAYFQVHPESTFGHGEVEERQGGQYPQAPGEEGTNDVCDLDNAARSSYRPALQEDFKEAGHDFYSISLHLRSQCPCRRYVIWPFHARSLLY